RLSAIAVGIAGTPANIDPHVAAIGPAQFLQALQERRKTRLCLLIIRGQAHEHADPPHLLRARRERPHRRAAEQRDELAPLHSIISSARASNDGGTVRPSTLAAWALITSSNFVDCMTARSAGLAPLRMRPV